ncbi:MAG: bifunctional 5,10-methylenetetrahydrofolate dehydrogenase/5,10-methenyltetrahydrofolate cyclohydrolase [Patescibacteria group bacterium]
MKIINGKKIAHRILEDLKKEIKKQKIKPRLAVILVGHNPASCLYVKIKEKVGQSIGIEIEKHFLSSKTKEWEIINIIDTLNNNNKINGILVQLPLPQGLSTDRIIKEISIKKDVDGFLSESRFESPFILAIYEAIKATGEDLKNKKIIALVNSDIFGKKLESKLGAKYVIGSSSLAFRMTKQADILITALGCPGIIKGDMIKKDVILIDGGISKIDDKIIGDIDAENVKDKAKWLSPVPGGLGPLTVAFLMKNVIEANKL